MTASASAMASVLVLVLVLVSGSLPQAAMASPAASISSDRNMEPLLDNTTPILHAGGASAPIATPGPRPAIWIGPEGPPTCFGRAAGSLPPCARFADPIPEPEPCT